MSGMPAFDGRRNRTGWINITPLNGWTLPGQLRVVNGWCCIAIDGTKAAWAAEIFGSIPAEALPSRTIRAAAHIVGTGSHAAVSVDTAGNLYVEVAGTGGVWGELVYPVG